MYVRHLKKVYSSFIYFIFVWTAVVFGQDPDHTIKIPMRDGVELATDLYLPENKSEKYPCILIRSPAGRSIQPWKSYSSLSHFGYAVAIQDTRSASDPDGKTFPYYHDGWGQHQDGYDTVEWLSKSSWTNGKIGTIGISAAGITQLFMAAAAPPSLICQYIGFAASNMHAHAIYPGGQFLKNQVEGWLAYHAKDKGVLSYIFNHPRYNDFWDNFNSIKVSHQTKVPGLLYSGWYDTFLQGTLDAFIARQNNGGEGARGKQKLLIGPWTHYWPMTMALGDFEVPVDARSLPETLSPQKWFDYYLKGQKNEVESLPAVTYYVMGPFDQPAVGHVWRTANQWPVPARETSLYLASNKKLTLQSEEAQSGVSFFHDPLDPVPTIGGRNLFLESGPKDQRPIEARPDVVLFTTSPFEKEVEVTGPIVAKLFITSDCKDTDIVVRLTDVYPDGRSILITDGIFRTHDQKADAGPHEIAVDLWSASFVMAKGHSLRLSVSGSNYPRYEVNPNTGLTANKEGHKVTCNTLQLGGKMLSRLILPITREGDNITLK